MEHPECEAIQLLDTGDAYSDNCYFRRSVKIDECEWCPKMAVWIAPKVDLTLYKALGKAWRSIPGLNCYPGRGADRLAGKDSLPGHRLLYQCEEACLENPLCQGFVWHDYKDARSDNCYLRGNIDVDSCMPDKAWNLRLRPAHTPVPPTPSPPAPPPTESPQSAEPLTTFVASDANIPCCNQYRGAASAKGKAIFAPSYARSVGIYDLATTSFSTVALSQVSDTIPLFNGAAAVGDKVVFAPWDAHFVGVFDVEKSAFSTTDISSKVKGLAKFSGAVEVSGMVVFAPYSASVIGLYEVASNNFQIVDISSKLAGGMKFSGAAESGGKVIFAPFGAQCVGIFDPKAGFSTVDISLKMISKGDAFAGAASVGSTIIFAPYDSKVVGIFDLPSMEFSTVDISGQVSGDSLFSGSSVFGSRVYFAPDQADGVGVFDVHTSRFSLVTPAEVWDDSMKFQGATLVTGDNPAVVFAPASTKVGLISAGHPSETVSLRLSRLDADIGVGVARWTPSQTPAAFAVFVCSMLFAVYLAVGVKSRRLLGMRALHASLAGDAESMEEAVTGSDADAHR